MKLLEQVADTVVGWQRKRKVAAQVNEIGSTDGTRPFFPEIVGKLLQALGNIGSHDALFLNVLGTPSGVFAFAVKLSVLQSVTGQSVLYLCFYACPCDLQLVQFFFCLGDLFGVILGVGNLEAL